MPLLKSTGWQILQILTVLWCVVVSVVISISATWTMFDNRTLLPVLLQLVTDDELFGTDPVALSNVTLIRATVIGSTSITITAMIVALISSFVIIMEKRILTNAFAFINGLVTVAALVFAILAFVAKTRTEYMSGEMLSHGMEHYTQLDDLNDTHQASNWRYVVDDMQIHGQCCGLTSHKDYESLFPQVTVATPDGTFMRNACICRDEARKHCGLQHVPLSCCVRAKTVQSVDEMCATSIFGGQSAWVSPSCPGNVSLSHRSTLYHSEKGCGGIMYDMPHVQHIKHYATVNLLIVATACLLSIFMALLASKTISRQKLIAEEVQIAFKVDPLKAAKFIDEAKDPSLSIQSQREDSRMAPMAPNPPGDFTQRDATRLSSDRLARPPSSRMSQATRRRR